jgi:hypothetical protein
MKRLIIKLIVVAAIVALVLTLASCGGGLSGRYVSTGTAVDELAIFNDEAVIAVEFKAFGDAIITTTGQRVTPLLEYDHPQGTVTEEPGANDPARAPSMLSARPYSNASYKVSNGQLILLVEWSPYAKAEGTYTFSESGDSIYIDGHEYMK